MSTASSRRPFQAYSALAGAMLVYFAGCGNIVYSFGVFLPLMCDEFGWTRATVGGAYSLMVVLMGVLGPVAGFSVTRFGTRKNIVFGNLVCALGLAGLSVIGDVWQLYLFFGVAVGVGGSFGLLIPSATVASNWFENRSSFAVGLVLAAGGIGGLAVPPIVSEINVNIGWQTGWLVLAGLHVVLAVFIAGLLVGDKPEQLEPFAGGPTGQEASQTTSRSPMAYKTAVDWGTNAALRTTAFWLVALIGAAHLFAVNTVLPHQVAYIEDMGFSPLAAASALGVLPGMSIVGRLFFGPLEMRLEVRHIATVFLTGMLIAVLVLHIADSLTSIYIYAVLFGTCYGVVAVARPALLIAFFGRKNFAHILGWHLMIATLVGAPASPIAGLIHDATGSYSVAFFVTIAVLAVGIVSSLVCKSPQVKERNPS
ncbi:MFS transporter [Chloroflexota bacterium]